MRSASLVRSLLRVGWANFVIFLDSLVMFLPRAKSSDGVAIVRLDAIGDYFIWRECARALVQHYHAQGLRVVLIANSLWADYAQTDLDVDEVWKVARTRFRRDWRYRLAITTRVQQAHFDTIISPVFSRDFLGVDALVRVSGARERIGSSGDTSVSTARQKRRSDRWYTQLVPASTARLMEFARNREFVSGLGIANQGAQPLHRRSSVTSFASKHALQFKSYFVIAPGAAWEKRRWPVARMAEVARRLTSLRPCKIVVCGSPNESQLSQQLTSVRGVEWVNLCGTTTLEELVDVVAEAILVITNDTATVHIAAATGTPCVSVLGGGHHGRFLPYDLESVPKHLAPPSVVFHEMPCFGCNWNCRYATAASQPVPCIDRVSTDAVWERILEVLGTSAHASPCTPSL